MKNKAMLIASLLFVLIGVAFSETKEIRYVDFRVYDPVYIGIKKGFFEKRGVKVSLTGSILAGPTAIQAVGSGLCDAGLSFTGAIINANIAGIPVQGVSDIQSSIGDQPLEKFFVRNESDIKTSKDIKGKRIGVNLWKSSFYYTAMMELEKNGMSESSVNFLMLSFDNQISAIEEGRIDVAGLIEPYATYLESTGRYRVLFDAIDVFGDRQFTLHFVNRRWAEKNPLTATAFVSGITDSIEWIKDNQEEAKEIIAEYTGFNKEHIPSYIFQDNGAVVMNDVSFWVDYMEKTGDIKNGSVEIEDVATNKYNNLIREGR